MSDEPRIAAFALAPAIAGLTQLGLDVRTLQDRAGIPDLERCDAELRIPYRNAARLWDLVVDATGDPAIGLRVAETVKLERFDLIVHLARSNASFRDVMRDVDRYGGLLADGIRFVLRDDWQTPTIVVEFAGPGRPHPAGADYALGVLCEGMRNTRPRTVMPAEIQLSHAPPLDPGPYTRFFRAPVRFAADQYAVVLRGASTRSSLLPTGADTGLHEFLERAAAKALRTEDGGGAFERRLRDVIRTELPSGRPEAGILAERLGIGERSLRRRLAARGTSVSRIVDGVRLELATRYLGESRMSVAEAARRLGFSEPSAFHRAFRRWTGKTPRGFARERHGTPEP